MLTSKERADLRAQANALETTLMVSRVFACARNSALSLLVSIACLLEFVIENIECLCPMGDLIFLIGRNLRQGLSNGGIVENGIIAEAALTGGGS